MNINWISTIQSIGKLVNFCPEHVYISIVHVLVQVYLTNHDILGDLCVPWSG